MQLEVRQIDMETKSPTVILYDEDAEELGVKPLDRIQIHNEGDTVVGIVETTGELVSKGEIGVTSNLSGLSGDVGVSLAPKPESVYFIRKKLDDRGLDEDEIDRIVRDINENRLNDIELGAYVSAIYTNGLSMEEIVNLTRSMVNVGDVVEWDSSFVADKHSIGGVAGNRVTPIIVSIIAAADILIPKSSSRAITSPAGTSDTVEVLCDVEFGINKIREIVDKTNGCMVWGGSVNLSPVDDKIIRAEYPLSLDPYGQVLASVLSKKKSTGSTHVVIDIPYGEGTKVTNLSKAKEMAEDFKYVGNQLDMEVECAITRGDQPIGNGIGPVLEAKDVLKVLKGEGPEDLRIKSLRLTEILLDMAKSNKNAEEILDSGKALKKFKEIIEAQNGDPNVEPEDLELGEYKNHIRSPDDGEVTHIDNELISEIAGRAGAPKDKKSGIYLHKKEGEEVREGEKLYTIYSEKKEKLEEALNLTEKVEEVRVREKNESLVKKI